MDLESVKAIIRKSLSLEADVEIENLQPIAELDADRVDVADILFKAGAYDQSHFSSGELNREGWAYLFEVAKSTRTISQFVHFYNLARAKDTAEVFKRLTPRDVMDLSGYKSGQIAA